MVNTISINGKTIVTNANSVQVCGDKIVIDGKDVTPDAKEITLKVEGSVENVIAEYGEVNVTGTV